MVPGAILSHSLLLEGKAAEKAHFKTKLQEEGVTLREGPGLVLPHVVVQLLGAWTFLRTQIML